MISITQTYRHPTLGPVQFIDQRATIQSAPAQPRDIAIITPGLTDTQIHDAREEIAVDIRIGQGANPIGVRRGLKFA